MPWNLKDPVIVIIANTHAKPGQVNMCLNYLNKSIMDRKALIDAYKNRKSRQGIFQIRNLENGKIFLESSTDLDKIENRHRFQLNMGGHPCSGLQADWKTYGDAAFVFETLYELDIPEDPAYDVKKELKLLEKMHLEELQPYGDKGYH